MTGPEPARTADHDAELDALVDRLAAAGPVESYADHEGRPTLRLTAEGASVARGLAMADAGTDDALVALLTAVDGA